MKKIISRCSLPMPEDNQFAGWWLYPDTFSYDFTADQYRQCWERIKLSSYHKIKEGMLPVPISAEKAATMQFKSWFGGSLNADLARVQMAMMKLLYYGYLHGYNTPDTVNFSEQFLAKYSCLSNFSICQLPRNNSNSRLLQSQLVMFYNQHSDVLRGYHRDMPASFSGYFGKSYAGDSSPEYFVRLDPQHPEIGDCLHIRPGKALAGSALQELLIRHRLARLEDLLNREDHRHDICELLQARHDVADLLSIRMDLAITEGWLFVRLYFLLAKTVAVFDDERDYYARAWWIVKCLPKDIAAFHYMNEFFLEHDVACSVMGKDDDLRFRWLHHLYSRVVSGLNHPKRMEMGLRILKEDPAIVGNENLIMFCDIALEKGETGLANALIKRLFQVRPDAAQQYLIANNELILPEAYDALARVRAVTPVSLSGIYNEFMGFFSGSAITRLPVSPDECSEDVNLSSYQGSVLST